MSHILHILWTIVPKAAPQPWLPCDRCGIARPFRSSGKFRLNANGRRLDAWLIYRCTGCDNSWNRPLFERRNVRDIDPPFLRALHANDPDLVNRLAFDVGGLRRHAPRVEECSATTIRKQALSERLDPPAAIEIKLVVPMTSGLRLDRLLAAELGVSRSRLKDWQAAGRLTLTPDGPRMLRRPVKDGTRISIGVSADDGPDLEKAAG